jgi:uncharacterized membrane protein
MIFYIYAPAVLATKWLGLSSPYALRLYVFLLGTLSLFICNHFLKKIVLDKNHFFVTTSMLIIAVVFYLLPFNEFGQREHFLLILAMPYFFLVSSRLQVGYQTNSLSNFLIGVSAGFGFAIKPHFFCAFLLVELYFLIKQGYFFAWFRSEVMGVFTSLLIYIIILIFIHYDYLTVVLPLITQYYYQDYHSPISVVAFANQALFCYLVVAFFLLRLKYQPYPQMATVLMMAAIGFFGSYFIPYPC